MAIQCAGFRHILYSHGFIMTLDLRGIFGVTVRSNWLWAVAVSLLFSLFYLRHVSCLLTYEFVYIVTYVYIVIYSMFGQSNKLN